MQIVQVQLHHIVPNPDQPREGENPAHIKNLAVSIAEEGLLQLPLGRLINNVGQPQPGSADLMRTQSIDQLCRDRDCRVQLAFGHSRLAAYKFLDETGNFGFDRMPVIVNDLTDEELFRRGVSENMARKDLSPIEEARAMLVYREKFGKTSIEIGSLFGLSDSAVRNKMRLLGLPEALQNALRAGEITEGVGRALVPLYDIPETLRLQAEDGDDLKPSEIIEAARSGISPDRVAEMVNRLTRRINPQPEQPAISMPLAPKPEPQLVAGVSSETIDHADGSLEDGDENLNENLETQDNEDEADAKNVSMETLVDEAEEEEAYDPAGEMVEEPQEPDHEPVEVKPPAPRPAPAPIRAPEPPRPAAAQPAPKPQPAPQTAPAATPVQPPAVLSWEQSTIMLTLTLWPEDSSGNRMVNIGGRLNQDAPLMSFARLADLVLPDQLQSILTRLHTEK